jgi:hypothetical protein
MEKDITTSNEWVTTDTGEKFRLAWIDMNTGKELLGKNLLPFKVGFNEITFEHVDLFELGGDVNQYQKIPHYNGRIVELSISEYIHEQSWLIAKLVTTDKEDYVEKLV